MKSLRKRFRGKLSFVNRFVWQRSQRFHSEPTLRLDYAVVILTPFDMGFFEPSALEEGRGMSPTHHNFVFIAPMIMKFDTAMKLDVFYTLVTKRCVKSLLLRNYYVITCNLADT